MPAQLLFYSTTLRFQPHKQKLAEGERFIEIPLTLEAGISVIGRTAEHCMGLNFGNYELQKPRNKIRTCESEEIKINRVCIDWNGRPSAPKPTERWAERGNNQIICAVSP